LLRAISAYIKVQLSGRPEKEGEPGRERPDVSDHRKMSLWPPNVAVTLVT
jgi:hypothetical protein